MKLSAKLRYLAIIIDASVDKVGHIRKCKASDIDPKRPKSEQRYCLYSKSTNKLLGRHPSRASALKQESAIFANK